MTGPEAVRITYLISRADTLGGAQVHVADLAQALRDTGHEVSVVVGGEGPFLDVLGKRSLSVVGIDELVAPISPKKDLRALLAIRRALRTLRPDLVSCHSSKAGLLGRVAGRSLRIPTIFTAHGWAMADAVPQPSRLVFGLSEWAAAPLASQIITVSREDQELARRWHIWPRRNLVTVPNGAHDVPEGQWADAGKDPARILMVARYEEPKDHDTLLRALAAVDAPWESLMLVGSGPGEASVRALVAELGLAERVEFHPIPSDVPALMARAQLSVLLSRREGLPRTIIEAMRSRLPVLASAVGGIPELVEDGVNGLLVRSGDLSHITEALEFLLRHPEERNRMGQAGRGLYDARFTFGRLVNETIDVYEAALGRRLLRPVGL